MSNFEELLTKIAAFASKAAKKALEDPGKVYVTLDMLQSAFEFANDLLDDLGSGLSAEEEVALYDKYSARLDDQKQIMKEKIRKMGG